MSLKIAIIGAGPVGCTLAHLLLNSSHNVSVTIFEAEPSLDTRTQGGTLDLHTKTGLLAIQKAGLYDKFLQKARFDGEALKFVSKNMKQYINISGGTEKNSSGRPEIDRKELRSMLIENLPEGTVKWGHRLCRITPPSPSSDPKHLLLEFENSSHNGFDLIVGADGAYSKARPLLTDERPFWSGVGCVRIAITDVRTAAPQVYALVNRGSCFAYGDHKGMMPQQMGDGSMSIFIMRVPSSTDWLKESPWRSNDLAAIKQELLSEIHDWDPVFKTCIEKSDQEPWISNLMMLPVGHRWTHRPGVTLIGDSAHLMTPFAGEGVNLGLEDALKLSNAILWAASSPNPSSTLSPAIKAFEEDMFTRAERTAKTTDSMMRLTLHESKDFPENGIEKWVCLAAVTDTPAMLYPLVCVAVYVYFFFFRIYHKFWTGK